MESVERHRREKDKRKKEEKRRAKEDETDEERRQRRLEKKQKKEEKRACDRGDEPTSSIGYTNMNNPFNDANLTDRFVWGKKFESEGKSSLSQKAMEKMHREKIARNIDEMQELRRNRAARDAARDDIEMMNREQERMQHSEWQRTEREFEISQAKARTMIRIKENRAKPIDLLFRFIKHSNGAVTDEVDMPPFAVEDPISYLKGLAETDLEDLHVDVNAMTKIDDMKNRGFWDDVRVVVKAEIDQIQGKSQLSSVHANMRTHIMNTFKNKPLEELYKQKDMIAEKIKKRDPGTDLTFYESLLPYIGGLIARLRMKNRYSELLKKKLAQIKEEQAEKMGTVMGLKIKKEEDDSEQKYAIPEEMDELQAEKIVRDNVEVPVTVAQMKAFDDEERELQWQQLSEDQTVALTLAYYEAGRYSPTYGDETDTMPGIEILDPEEDLKLRLQMQRKAKNGESAAMSSREAEMMNIAKKGMDKDESTFAVEENLGEQKMLWSDKYRPRKPRYFNRVHTGFDWNKYNQTHYDIDNPPPKIVQGYRFNIFYPDMLDHTQTPSFTVTQCEDPDFAIIRFKAGPPYEDIAFKVVNREWEVNHKHGYKCQFHNGVFQLWFFFKRYRYRR